MQALIHSNFDEDTIETYTHGECWTLAAIIHKDTKLPYIGIYDENECHHVGILTSPTTVMDVYGIWDVSDWESFWYEELEEFWGVGTSELTDEDQSMMAELVTKDWNKWDGGISQGYADKLVGMLV